MIKVICWDLDETLGNFVGISYEMRGENVPEFIRPVSLRYGISETLTDLSSQGYIHFVTTSGSREYAIEAVNRTGINAHFQEILGRDRICGIYGGKNYRPVAGLVGLSREQAASNMAIVGNGYGDKPLDVESVFIHDRNCLYTDSIVTSKILGQLNGAGEGDFIRGFRSLHHSAVPEEETSFSKDPRKFSLDGIELTLEYRTNSPAENCGNHVIPTIEVVDAAAFKKDPVPAGL